VKRHVFLLFLFFILLSQFAQALSIYSGKLLIVEIPPAHFQQIATSRVKQNGHEFNAIQLNELIAMCQSSADSIEIRGESDSIRLSSKQWQDDHLFLLFNGNGSANLFSNDSTAHFPNAVEKITLLKKNYFSVSFLVEIFLLTAAGLFIFRKTRSLSFQSCFLFIACFLIYWPFDLPDMGNVSDNLWYVPTSLSILKEGNLELSEYGNIANFNHPDYRIIHLGNSIYNAFPVGPSIFPLPLVWIGGHLYPPSIPAQQRIQDIAALVAKIIASLAVALLFLLARRLSNGVGISLLAALLFGFATNHFNTHAGGLWSHNVSLPLLIAALWMLTSARPHVVSLSAIPLAMLYVTRPTYILAISIITIYVIACRRRSLALYVLLGASCAAAFFLFNYEIYGHLLSPHYENSTFGISNFVEGLAGHMISPNRGLLIFTPIFVLSFVGSFLSWRHGGSPYFRLLSILVFADWLMLALQVPPRWGGHCIGPRQFCDMLPVWILLILPTIQFFSDPNFNFRIPAFLLISAFIGWSLFVQLRSVTDPAVHQWNDDPVTVEEMPSRVWDSNDMQIFRRNSIGANEAVELWCGPTEIAKMPEPYFKQIATSKIRFNQRTLRAEPVAEFVKLCGMDVNQIRISSEKKTLTANSREIQDMQLFFIAVRGRNLKESRLYSPDSGTYFDEPVRKITVEN
jgi:hypothetical protein